MAGLQQSGAWNSRNAQAMSQSTDSLHFMKPMQSQAPSNKDEFQEAAVLLGGGSEPREPRGVLSPGAANTSRAPEHPSRAGLQPQLCFHPSFTHFWSQKPSRKLPAFALSEME